MKTFTTAEIRDLYNRFFREEISFSRMVEEINQRVSEAVKPNFKEGDFLHSDWDDENITIIFKNRVGENLYYHASKSCFFGATVNNDCYWRDECDFRLATEEEKQKLLDALAKKGKRWNAEKKCVEDITKRKFQKGDKVRIKEGVSSKTHNGVSPYFMGKMDDLIGKTMTVERYTDGDNYVKCEGTEYSFLEDWLEPYTDELKEGDLAIFWNNGSRHYASVRMYGGLFMRDYCDTAGVRWDNAIKFESKGQFERLIKREI